jgi:flagellar basal body-associated protein FliL
MVLTDIMREEEKRMKKNEKQIIISLGVAIAVVAIALIAMMITSGNSDNGQSSSLKDAVQQESNGNGSDDVSESDAGESVSEEDAGESGDNMTTEQPTTQETTEEVTEEATTAAKNNTASNVMDADDGYIFPDADTSYVSKSSVKKLSDEELQYAVNEVYARHGLKFTKKKNKERFEKKEWYVGTVDDQNDISLNKYEKKNVDTMAAELKKRGLR